MENEKNVEAPVTVTFPVLMYHSLSDGRYPDREYGKYSVTTRNFQEHLRALCDVGFNLSSISGLLKNFRETNTVPDRCCVITFDDGHRSNLEMAEILQRIGASGTFFLTSEYCEKRKDFLSNEEIVGLHEMGFDLGAHGVTHRSLRHMPKAQMHAELKESKEWLEDLIQTPVNSMSLPAGQGNRKVFQAAFQLGYDTIGTSVEKRNHIVQLPAILSRFVVLNDYTPGLVTRIAEGSPLFEWKRRLRSELLRLPKAMLKSFDRTRE